jgi:hypothetical protein
MNEGTKTALKFGGATIVFMLLGYAVYSIRRQIKLIKDLSVKFNSLEGVSYLDGMLSMKVGLLLSNLSDLTITTKSVDVNIFINGQYVANLKEINEQIIKPKKSSLYKFDVKINLKDNLKRLNIDSVISMINYKNLFLGVKGMVTGSVDVIPFENIKFEINEKIGEILSKEKK